jgi:hypothetical protein
MAIFSVIEDHDGCYMIILKVLKKKCKARRYRGLLGVIGMYWMGAELGSGRAAASTRTGRMGERPGSGTEGQIC